MKVIRRIMNTLLLIVPLIVTGCSGGGGDDGGIEGSGAIAGVAAEGNPIKNRRVTLKSTNGTTIETQTNAAGEFSFKLTPGMAAPYFLKVSRSENSDLHSIVTTNVAADTTVTANIHPLSDIAVRNWFRSRNRDIDNEFTDGVEVSNAPTSTQIDAILDALKNLLLTAFSDFSINENFNLISSEFSANSTEFDRLLDHTTVRLKEDLLTLKLKNFVSGLEFEAIIILNFNITLDLAIQDTAVPTPPTAVNVIAAGETGAVVVWNASEDNVGIAGYDIYRSNDNTDVKLATTSFPVFSDTTLSTGVEYCYRIEAFDGAGNKSGQTTPVCVTPQQVDNTPPATVTNLTVTTVGFDEIRLTWTPPQDPDVIGYDVYRAGVKIATVVASNYSDINLTASTEYCYLIRAFDAAGNRSADSSTVCETTPEEKPSTGDTEAPTVNASPAGGVFMQAQNVVLSCNDGQGSGCASIFYTQDGTTPTTSSTPYSTAIAINSNTTLNFLAVDNTGNQSNVVTQQYIIDQAPPISSANPQGGAYTSPQSVSLSCDDGSGSGCAAIYYTTDGTTPTTSSAQFSSAISIIANTTLQFFAVDNVGNQESVIHTEVYTIDSTPPVSSANPQGDAYTSPQSVSLSCDDGSGSGCVAIYYTTDGTTPTISSAQFSSAISIISNTTLQFFAVDNVGNQESVIHTEVYTIDSTPPVSSANPQGGAYTSPQSVSLSCDDGSGSGCAAIYYTTNGTPPTISSAQFSSAISMSANTTLRFFAVDNAGNQESVINVETYTFPTPEPLKVDVSVQSTPVISGGRALYIITLSNHSLQTINNIGVTYEVPTGIQFHQNDDAEPNTSVNCSNFECNESEQAQWTFPSLAAGASTIISINAQVLAGQINGDSITALITVTADELSQAITNNKSIEINNTPSAQLSISANKDPVMPGETYTLNLDLGNISGSVLTNTQLRAFLPPGVTVNSISDGGTDLGNGEVLWDLSTVTVGAALHREIVITAPTLNPSVNSDILASRAQLSFDGGAEVDVIAEQAVTVLDDTPSFAVSITATPNPVPAGNVLAYTITINNLSALPVNNINLLYRVPRGIQFHQNNDATPNTSVNCSNFECNEGEEAWWNIPTLAAGASATININAQVTAGLLDGTLISAPITATANELADTINLLHSVSIAN